MKKQQAFMSFRRTSAFIQAAVLATTALLPVLLLGNSAGAVQLDNRFIDMSGNQTSDGSGRDGGDAFGQDVTYRVGFDVNQAHANIEGIVVDFCSNSPVYGDSCTAPTGFNVNEGTVLVTANTGITSTWAVHANTDANTLIITKAAGDNLSAGATVAFTLGSNAAADGITNPTTLGSFYARIVTYTDDTFADGYVSTAPDTDGAHRDEGGVALSTARELTITARVQEVLEFCIGTEVDSAVAGFTGVTGDSCTQIAGTDISLGVVDSSNVQRTSDGDINNDGIALVRTNALVGAVVYYKAEQESGLTNGGAGTLRQTGGDNCGTIASVANVCFNSAGGDVTNPAQSAVSAGTEKFGMTLTNLSTGAGGATSNLSCDAAYDGDGTCTAGAATGYAWDPTGVFDTIASSAGPTDDERANIEFAATASPTTPTGLYTVTANFVATSTF